MQLQQAIDGIYREPDQERKGQKDGPCVSLDLGIASGFFGAQKPLGAIIVQQAGKSFRADVLHQRTTGYAF